MSRSYISARDRRNREELTIMISGLQDGEIEMFESAIGNCSWIMADEDGRIQSIPKYKALPDPIDDDDMLPFWSKTKDENIETSLKETPVDTSKHPHPQIIISSLCGYNYSPENYRIQARRLKDFGFEQMRSQRDSAGRFTEHWFLEYSGAAEGNLKLFIDKLGNNIKAQQRLDAIIDFLCKNVSFGSLEIAYQRAAMVISD